MFSACIFSSVFSLSFISWSSKTKKKLAPESTVFLLYSWHTLVVLAAVMVTMGAFIFGLTTTNSIYQDVVS